MVRARSDSVDCAAFVGVKRRCGWGCWFRGRFSWGLGVFFVVMTVSLQSGLGFKPLQTGLLFLPFAVGFSLGLGGVGPGHGACLGHAS